MRKSETRNIRDVIGEYLESMELDKRLKEVNIIRSWEEIIGKSVAKATKKIYIKNKVMFIYLNSAVVKNELLMIRSGLVKAINDRAGEEIITEIVLK